jgi:hypothetical protein
MPVPGTSKQALASAFEAVPTLVSGAGERVAILAQLEAEFKKVHPTKSSCSSLGFIYGKQIGKYFRCTHVVLKWNH